MPEKPEPDEREVITEWGAGIARWLPLDLSVKRTITNRWKTRVDDFGSQAAAGADLSREQVAQRLEDNEVLSDTFLGAAEKAGRTADQSYRSSLARLVAAGLRDDARVDEAAYFTSVLTQLEPVHLRYLAANVKAHEVLSAAGKAGNPTVEFVSSLAKIPVVVAASVAERLHAFSLLTDRLRGDMVDWKAVPLGAFAVTDAGRALLAYCEQRLDSEP
jgi:hypothetical protein